MSYTTFVVVDCKFRKIILVTSSARKAKDCLCKGVRVEVWRDNTRVETIYNHTLYRHGYAFGPYIQTEREYIRRKQARAEQRNKRRKEFGNL